MEPSERCQLLVEQRQIEYLTKDCTEDRVCAVLINAIVLAAVQAVLIPATEALTEIVVVLRLIYIVAGVSIVCVLVGKRVFKARAPSVLAVCHSSAESLFVTGLHSLPEQIRRVFIHLVVSATARVSIVRRGVEVRVVVVIVVSRFLQPSLLLLEPLVVPLLVPVLSKASLRLQSIRTLLRNSVLPIEIPTILIEPYTLLINQLALTLLREPLSILLSLLILLPLTLRPLLTLPLILL